jgi:hypothetical protein
MRGRKHASAWYWDNGVLLDTELGLGSNDSQRLMVPTIRFNAVPYEHLINRMGCDGDRPDKTLVIVKCWSCSDADGARSSGGVMVLTHREDLLQQLRTTSTTSTPPARRPSPASCASIPMSSATPSLLAGRDDGLHLPSDTHNVQKGVVDFNYDNHGQWYVCWMRHKGDKDDSSDTHLQHPRRDGFLSTSKHLHRPKASLSAAEFNLPASSSSYGVHLAATGKPRFQAQRTSPTRRSSALSCNRC